ncbi:glycosyltransferase family 1 protein [Pelagicoccus enzymogenes]|uniref:glycosyltransferase family 4 protein n=1 Tax=Pelagicoccus enzymogenes TaxID=2773457 RepID=UPI00280E30BE|nr:glycosyltransferase family 1 protein [Pelagicoccus enzymogenes]MDQ8199945.1 glycosyltransferase family 1 protein [Pelagicoccus enzymogenes]
MFPREQMARLAAIRLQQGGEMTASSRPLQVAYDIARLSAGGANGGIKVHHYEFLRRFVEKHSHEIRLFVFCREEIVPELGFLAAAGHHQVHVLGPREGYDPRRSEGSLPLLRYWPEVPEDLLSLLGIDVLYAGFGFSQLYTPNVPQVSLIVDVLHRSYPKSLPPAEVDFRDRWYAEAIEKSALVQTNSAFCKEQLVDEFGADPQKTFVISLPLHGRFDTVKTGSLPAEIATLSHPYFLYPANYWPHKNHEILLVAFAHFIAKNRGQPWQLVLTGTRNERTPELEALARTLGIDQLTSFLDHLELGDFKLLWEKAHALVFPSLYEGFGLPVLEAMHFNKPIACGDYCSFKTVDSPFLLRFDARIPTEVSRAMEQLVHLPSIVDWSDHLGTFDIDIECRALLRTLSFQQTPPIITP